MHKIKISYNGCDILYIEREREKECIMRAHVCVIHNINIYKYISRNVQFLTSTHPHTHTWMYCYR